MFASTWRFPRSLRETPRSIAEISSDKLSVGIDTVSTNPLAVLRQLGIRHSRMAFSQHIFVAESAFSSNYSYTSTDELANMSHSLSFDSFNPPLAYPAP